MAEPYSLARAVTLGASGLPMSSFSLSFSIMTTMMCGALEEARAGELLAAVKPLTISALTPNPAPIAGTKVRPRREPDAVLGRPVIGTRRITPPLAW